MPFSDVRVLYVDDDPGIARLVEKALVRRSFRFEHAANGQEALERVGKGGIDAIGLDHHMPGGTGLDFLSELGKTENPPPVVYVTSSGDSRVAVSALKAGASDYVSKDVGGDFLELLGTAIENAIEQTRLKRAKQAAEEAVREERDRAEMLLREVNHRVGNSLALVAALVRMQSTAVSDPAAVEALKETQARITAIAGIHRRLYTSQDVRFVDAGAYLKHLVQELELALGEEDRPHHVLVDADPAQVPPDKAVSLGVVVTELVTNAYKYAYPDGEPGEIRVSLKQLPDEKVRLVVEDDGVGWTGVGTPRGTGLGSRIVDAMATNLRSTVEFDTNRRGTSVSLEFAL